MAGRGATAPASRVENRNFVGLVTATDLDGDAVTYAITGGDDAALFTIDADTGALSFVAAPDFEDPAEPAATMSTTCSSPPATAASPSSALRHHRRQRQ